MGSKRKQKFQVNANGQKNGEGAVIEVRNTRGSGYSSIGFMTALEAYRAQDCNATVRRFSVYPDDRVGFIELKPNVNPKESIDKMRSILGGKLGYYAISKQEHREIVSNLDDAYGCMPMNLD